MTQNKLVTRSEYLRFDEAVNSDLDVLLAQEELDFDERTELRIYIQTIQGHAMEGHGRFRGKPCIATCGEISEALYERIHETYKLPGNPERFKKDAAEFVMLENEKDIYSLEEYIYQIIEGKKPRTLKNKRKTLFGHLLYKEMALDNPLNFLKGAWVGAFMDSSEVRAEVEKKFGIAIGRGEIFLGNWPKLLEDKKFLKNLQTMEHSKEEIEEMLEQGILLDKGEVNDKLQQVYVRHKKGELGKNYKQNKIYKGIHDGLMVLLAGIVWGVSGAIGLNALDITDTIDKNIKHFVKGGWDERIGRIIEENQELISKNHNTDFILDKDLLHKLIFLGAIPKRKPKGNRKRKKGLDLDSPSTRYINRITPDEPITTLESYLMFIKGNVPPNKFVGPIHCETRVFDEIEYLLERIKKTELIEIPSHLREIEPIIQKGD